MTAVDDIAERTVLPTRLADAPTRLVGAGPAAPGRPARFGLVEVYALIALASFLVARFVPVLELHYPCAFRAWTGHPCATCGMTHAFVYLAHGQLAEALRWSPLGAALAAGGWALALADAVRVIAGWPLPRVSDGALRRAAVVGLGLLTANWAFLLLHPGLGR